MQILQGGASASAIHDNRNLDPQQGNYLIKLMSHICVFINYVRQQSYIMRRAVVKRRLTSNRES